MSTSTSSASVEAAPSSKKITLSALIEEKRYALPAKGKLVLTYSFLTADSTFVSDYHGGEDGRAFLLSEAQKDAVRLVLAEFAAIANIRFKEVADDASSAGVMRFGGDSADSTAHAYLPSATAEAGDVWIGPSIAAEAIEIGSYDYTTLIHEIGHALGLKHPGKYSSTDEPPFLPAAKDTLQYSTMSYNEHAKGKFQYVTYPPEGGSTWTIKTVYASSPMLLDVQALQYMYGANSGYKKGNTVYKFDESMPFLDTIWDGGGKDTINASNFDEVVKINLNDGTYSSLTIKPDLSGGAPADPSAKYDGTNNLAIAYKTFIENAVGGSADDVLTGNEKNNQLKGGDGDDRLLGKNGKDRLIGEAGADTQIGGAGADRFIYNSSSHGGDTIKDFKLAQKDRIQFKGRAFGGLSKGVLAAANFVSNADGVAADADDFFTFSTTSNSLFYDADASGAGAKVLIAKFSNGVHLKNKHIVIA